MTRFQMLACFGVALSSVASAQDAPKPIPRSDYVKIVDTRFNNADTNHDGFLSKAEIVAQAQRDVDTGNARIKQQLEASFNRLDTNHDGKLTLQEFLGAAPPVHTAETPDQLLVRFDTNHDGKISADEFRAPELAKFNKVDSNHDGIVTPQEIQAAGGK